MEVSCYNRGCGKKFNPRDNSPDSTACSFHPGAPYFHDAYKGWSCCNKKCTDFTEFLNFPGTLKSCVKEPISQQKISEIVIFRLLLDRLCLSELDAVNGKQVLKIYRLGSRYQAGLYLCQVQKRPDNETLVY